MVIKIYTFLFFDWTRYTPMRMAIQPMGVPPGRATNKRRRLNIKV